MKKILVIDDDKRIRDMLNRILKSSGYDIYEAENGKIGIKMFSENQFDLAIVDIVMPEMEGLETIKCLKKTDEKCKIISITGGGCHAPATYLSISKKFGADVSLLKPIENKLLIKTVENLLEQNVAV